MAAEFDKPDKLESAALTARPFALGAVFLLAFVIVSMVVLWLVFLPNADRRFHLPSQPQSGPKLQADPSVERDRVLAEQRKRLDGYRWIDKKNGVFSIPLGRAMAIIAAKGANAYAPIAAATAHPQQSAPQ
ncbi:MAG TPA: hypothetical protein VFX37_04330 [Pseudolabrys sp.]|nr:hypothetical protein [Pseudolabrys sp.]